MRIRILAVMALLLAWPGTGRAEPPGSVAEDLAACQDEARPEVKRIQSCTDVLSYKSEPPEVHAEALFNRAWAFEGLGKSREALADYDEAVRLNPDYASIHIYRGGLHEQLGAVDTAIADFSTAIRLDPSIAEGFVRRGRAFLIKGVLDRALADLDVAIAQDGESVDAHVARGIVHERQERREQARRDFRRALELDPESSDAQAGLRRLQGA